MSDRAEYQKQWKAKNPDYAKNYYQRNRKDILAKQKQYNQARKDAKNAYDREYYQRVKLCKTKNTGETR